MRPWRDIVSTQAWSRIAQSTDSTAHISKVASLRSVFDANVETPQRSLRALTELITQYHAIPKTDYLQLDRRVAALSLIRDRAEHHLAKFKVDMDRAKERFALRSDNNGTRLEPATRNRYTQRYEVGNALHQTLDRNLLTLCNRSFRKAEYLHQLKTYYAAPAARSPQALLAQLAAPQQRTATSTGLTAGVRMEALDPWHRPVEVDIHNGQLVDQGGLSDDFSMSAAFAQWYDSVGTHGLPFFLWLEGHPICTSDNKEDVAGTASVYYHVPGAGYDRVPPRFKLAMAYVHGGRLWMDEFRVDGAVATSVANTAGYVCASGKGVSDAAAYIWTGQEVVIAQHTENAFHHSSFAGGRAVRCAGMLKMANGLLVYASNNSGHYKPGKHLLQQFLQAMQTQGVLAGNCQVHCQGVNPQYSGTAADFLQRWQTL